MIANQKMSCPDCPDGYVWNSKGQTDAACQTCGGRAWVMAAVSDADREMFGDEPERSGLQNIGNK